MKTLTKTERNFYHAANWLFRQIDEIGPVVAQAVAIVVTAWIFLVFLFCL